MKKIITLLIIAAAFVFSAVNASAAFDGSKLENALPPAANEILGDASVDTANADGILSRLGNYIKKNIRNEFVSALRPVCSIIAAAVVCTLADGIQTKKEFDYVNLAACLFVAVGSIGDVNSVASLSGQAVREMHEFSLVLLPMLSSAAAAAGAVSSAAAKYAATALFLDMMLSAAEKLLLPILGAYIAALLASAATGDGRLKGVVKLMKWTSKRSLICIVSVFTFYLSISGIASSGADAAAVKTAKALIGSFVPVVGKMVAGASESLAAGAGIIRNSIGLFGLGGVLALCAAPFLEIGIRYLLFKAVASVVSVIAGERLGSFVDGIGQAYGMLLGLVGTTAVFMFVSILSLIRTVV